jgi:hypothetical protein
VCGADGRCIDGCGQSPTACVGGSQCDAASGECVGGTIIGAPCQDDSGCDPPDIVCRVATKSCVAGCTLSGLCAAGQLCDPKGGHCCDVGAPGCEAPDGGAPACNGDPDCGAPNPVCVGGHCVTSCTTSGCAPPLSCDALSGHCRTLGCARDADCDSGSFCDQTGACEVLPYGGPSACAGGRVVSYTCATQESPAAWRSCTGAPGAAGCPYCIDGSCFRPGLCQAASDCHRGDDCVAGLCRVSAPECPVVVPLSQVAGGMLAAGKEVCVHDRVAAVRSGYDGIIEIKLGAVPYLFVDVPIMYRDAGVQVPTPGVTVTVHGTVRWDAGHADWELLPVDFVGP